MFKKPVMKNIIIVVVILLALFLLIQLVPFGHDHTNPAVVSEPNWDSPQTRELAKRACFDCHSNETTWPWYSNIAPVSWLLQKDVNEGRSRFNFSDWQNNYLRDPNEFNRVINGGEMPPPQYRLMHPTARLTDAEKQQLLQGLQATISK
jgi:hypothetical protein